VRVAGKKMTELVSEGETLPGRGDAAGYKHQSQVGCRERQPVDNRSQRLDRDVYAERFLNESREVI